MRSAQLSAYIRQSTVRPRSEAGGVLHHLIYIYMYIYFGGRAAAPPSIHHKCPLEFDRNQNKVELGHKSYVSATKHSNFTSLTELSMTNTDMTTEVSQRGATERRHKEAPQRGATKSATKGFQKKFSQRGAIKSFHVPTLQVVVVPPPARVDCFQRVNRGVHFATLLWRPAQPVENVNDC